VPSAHWSFGRFKVKEENERVVEFSIDGPGGERIETIEMRQYYAEPHGALPWLVKEGTMVRCEVKLSVLSLDPLSLSSAANVFKSQASHKSWKVVPHL